MGKNQNKTTENDRDPAEFLAGVEPERRRDDGFALLELMGRVSGEPAKMWGTSIIGFGSYHYKYDSGREGDHMLVGFSPRKAKMVLYIMPGFSGVDDLMTRLGKHKVGKSCLYVNKLADVDMEVLEELVRQSVAHMRAKYGV